MLHKDAKIDWLLNILQGLKRGETLLHRNIHGEWRKAYKICPNVFSDPKKWKLEEFPKPVDLSVLIETGIDCEFSSQLFIENGVFPIGKLKKIKNKSLMEYVSNQNIIWNHCRPRMHEWLVHQGEVCPLPEGFLVTTFTRSNYMLSNKKATTLAWGRDSNDDIIQFKVEGLAEGYCWPWDK
jgi:hypothetical protein